MYSKTYWTIFTIASGILAFVRFVTFAFSTDAFSMAGAEFVFMFSVGSHACFLRRLTFASSVPRDIIFSEAFAFSTIANSMIRTRTKLSVIPITREIVTLTVVSGNNLETTKQK